MTIYQDPYEGAEFLPIPAARKPDLDAGSCRVKITDFLMFSPKPADIARFLTLSLPWPESACGALIISADDAGTLSLVGHFGDDSQVDVAGAIDSIFTSHPIAIAIRLGQSMRYVNGGENEHHGQAQRNVEPLPSTRQPEWIVLPLGASIGAVGAICVVFEDHVAEDSVSFTVLRQLAEFLSVYLHVKNYCPTPKQITHTEVLTSEESDKVIAIVDEWRMTERQAQILLLMAARLTNIEIAHELDYSESTIRHETMVIFRILGVKDRREAARVVRAHGFA